MRSYLQRGEVRLSTMHRVVTAFVSGAALMLLIPVFFKDIISSLIQILLNGLGNRFPHYGDAGVVLTIILYGTLIYVLGGLAYQFSYPCAGFTFCLRTLWISTSLSLRRERRRQKNCVILPFP
jgi:hypothetical protein